LNDLDNRRDTRKKKNRTSNHINKTFDHTYIYLYVCASSIRIHNQTHKVIIKFFRVRAKNGLAAVAILSAAVSIPVVPYIQGHVVNARLYLQKESTKRRKKSRREFFLGVTENIRRDKTESTDSERRDG